MHDMLLLHVFLFNRPEDWTIDRSAPVYDLRPARMARITFRQMLLACL